MKSTRIEVEFDRAPQPPVPPPVRIVREGAGGEVCEICYSSLKRRWFGVDGVIGCLQPQCWNWHGWSQLPAGRNRPANLYGAPGKPPYLGSPPVMSNSIGREIRGALNLPPNMTFELHEQPGATQPLPEGPAMNLMPTSEGDVCAVRVRVGLFGRPVIQIQRRVIRSRWPREDELAPQFEVSTAWRDASSADVWDLVSYMDHVQRAATERRNS